MNERTFFDVIVVGAGLMGSACARHLSEMGVSVALIGPAEPKDKASHQGVFSSHYDEARITRHLATDRDWSRFSTTSIGRYAELEEKSGISFFANVGAMMAGPEEGVGSDGIKKVQAVAASETIDHVPLRGVPLADAFPYLSFPDGILALYEPNNAGWVNPRRHVAAEIAAAQLGGAEYVQTEVANIEEGGGVATVVTTDGAHYQAKRIVVAGGAFSNSLLPKPVPLTVYARTIAFLEINEEESARLKTMPSIIYDGPDGDVHVYILPPVKYPDGKTYLKIGGDPVDFILETEDDMKEWFRGNGNEEAGEFLAGELLRLMPGLNYRSVSYGSCVTSFTPSEKPVIEAQSDHIIALTGGNGAAAKCADELGRLGALVTSGKGIPEGVYDGPFGEGG